MLVSCSHDKNSSFTCWLIPVVRSWEMEWFSSCGVAQCEAGLLYQTQGKTKPRFCCTTQQRTKTEIMPIKDATFGCLTSVMAATLSHWWNDAACDLEIDVWSVDLRIKWLLSIRLSDRSGHVRSQTVSSSGWTGNGKTSHSSRCCIGVCLC